MVKEKLKNIIFGEKIQNMFNKSSTPIMFFVCLFFIIILLFLSSMAGVDKQYYSDVFLYISFVLSLFVLGASLSKRIRSSMIITRFFVLIIFIFLSFGYALLRVKCFSDFPQIENLGTAITIVISYFTIFLGKKK